MKRLWRLWLGIPLSLVLLFETSFPFCGFYVAKGDIRLFNKASQVVIVRDENRTVLTMANDFKGDPKEFAMVIPVPTLLTREQVHVGEKALLDHLEAYSAPRLVEYFDNPCQVMELSSAKLRSEEDEGRKRARAGSLGVTIEASYTVGEYDILILSARESAGLETWLRENGYRIPRGASAVLNSYLKQNMRFFVARVNLAEQAKLGYSMLRPLQVAYESPKFMLPIRLGTVNADGPQELFIYTLTRKGRVEATNYRTVKLPGDANLPVFLKEQGEFGKFYKALFDRQVQREEMTTLFLEYAWDMGWCDPCASDPLSREELRQLGVFWLDSAGPAGASLPAWSRRGGSQPAIQNVFLTRLHVRYDAAHFPEDLVFQETADRSNFQARYIVQHEWKGDPPCPAADQYFKSVTARKDEEARTLALLTGWDLQQIRQRMRLPVKPQAELRWWERIWNR